MYSSDDRKRKRPHTHISEDKTVILSGNAAQIDYEDTTPVWKQEVTDDQGRKRLHGAFTGGFSAGYFNTVGSAQGWTPSTFVSSRSNRYKAADNKAVNYMDEEDLADIEADRQLRIRKEEETKEELAAEMERSEQPGRHSHTQRPGESSSSDPARKNSLVAAQPKPRLAAPTGGSKALSLMNDDDDEDGFDIGPKIKYDHARLKKKVAVAQHQFRSRKVMKNPEPEPEILQHLQHTRTPSPVDQQPTVERLPLLPSIGDGPGDTDFVNPERRSHVQVDRPNVPKPPWQTSQASNEAKIPPWRLPQAPIKSVVPLGVHVAHAALESTFTPYSGDALKHARYRLYLETEAHNVKDSNGCLKSHVRDIDMDDDTWQAELAEFRQAALMYQPLTGAMSQKFTSSTPYLAGAVPDVQQSIQLKAAREGRYGHLTRTITEWAPSKLLLKRFSIDANSLLRSTAPRRTDAKSDKRADMDQRRAEVQDMMQTAMKGASKFVISGPS